MANLESIGGKLFVNGEEIALKSDLETKTQIVDFGTVSNNTRTVLPNPFFDGVNDAEIATRCIVRAEVQAGGVWGETAFTIDSANNARGIAVSSMLEGIVIQTGAVSIKGTNPAVYGHTFTDVTNLTSAPCRVIVSYQGELVLAPSLIPKPEYIDKDQLATAWVNFDDTGTILASYNVSSVTRVSTGIFEVNFTTAMDNINWATSGTASNRVGDGAISRVSEDGDSLRTVNMCRIYTTIAGGASEDFPFTSVTIHGGKN